MVKVYETTIAGRSFKVTTGKYAGLASGACMVEYGDTCVMCAATVAKKPRDGVDFFPLSVDFEEKLYAVGKIPGSFMKREGRPSDKAILASRVIDRPIRPLFPNDFRNDTSIVLTVMSVEQDNLPEIAALNGASIALSISGAPFKGPIGGVSVGYVNGEYVINPTQAQREISEMAVTVAGTEEKVVMIEAGANEVPEEIVYGGILKGHETIKEICRFIKGIQAEIGKPAISYESAAPDPEMLAAVEEFAKEKVKIALDESDKETRDKNIDAVAKEINEHFAEIYPESEGELGECLYKLQKKVVRSWILDEHKRPDGRGLLDIRPLSAEVGILPRTHGSGLFARGQTQVLTIATLGPIGEQQMLDGIDEEEYKRYMHHYNMPSYSVGETRPSRGPGRREIGHGALAERSLIPVLPSVEEFPYAIRLVSEVLSSNGSTSQGSVCGSTLALMDAGVPIKAPVAGISCGLVTRGEEWITMVDIQGLEDFFGDMDFKVAGTKKGITSIQMDIKVDGLTNEMIKKAIEQTRDARYYILDEVILKCIAEPRSDVSRYAPKMISMQIPVDKIREVIGSGGKVIQKIVADTGAKIDIEDDGSIFIAAVDKEAGEKAERIINAIVRDPEVGAIYTGRVVKVMAFGAFVEIAPGKEGLCHISKLDNKRVEKVEDVVHEGDEIVVKLTEIDKQGCLNLSRKDAMNELAQKKTENDSEEK